jgi:predicted nuclease of predicted toxin-antitoxin system
VKFKLDENFGTRTQEIFREAGHDVKTVRDEALSGTSDDSLYRVCQNESRCLVTLDLDFANTLRFPPENSAGIAVFRIPRNPSLSDLELLARQFLISLEEMSVGNNLWIVEVGRIRIHERKDVEDKE